MKLLLFSDLHANASAARRLVELSREADILIGAGDFGNMRYDLNVCIDILQSIERPTVLVAGNNESTEELTAACGHWKSAKVLHGQSTLINGVTFFGIGGGIPMTPFGDWSYDFTEEQADTLLESCPSGCVLISQSPPKGAVDVASSGMSLGSLAVRRAVDRVKPALVVCGHIHASAGKQERIVTTVVINAGPEGLLYQLKF